MGAWRLGAPGRMPGGAQGCEEGGSGVLAGLWSATLGTDSRPLLTRRRAKGRVAAKSRVASRNARAAVDFGVMKSVLRVEFRMFSCLLSTSDAAEELTRVDLLRCRTYEKEIHCCKS